MIMQVASQPTSPEPFSYVVDEDVEPIVDALPALDGNTVRTLAAVQDPHGNVASFVVDELVSTLTSHAHVEPKAGDHLRNDSAADGMPSLLPGPKPGW